MNKTGAIFVVLCCAELFPFGATYLGSPEEEVSLKSLPASIQQAAERLLGPGDREVDVETLDGVRVYEMESEESGSEMEILLTASGMLVELSRQIEIDQLPGEMLATLRDHYPDVEFEEVQKVESHSYRLEFDRDGKEHTVRVYPTGRIVEVDETSDND